MKRILIAIAFLFVANSLMAQLTDRDGNKYKTVRIGTQEWMTKDLNVSHFSNGDIIPEVEDSLEWMRVCYAGKPAWCYYNGDPANGNKYGKLYNSCAVNDPRGLAPAGWHIPTGGDWLMLSTYLGGDSTAGTKMKFNKGWYLNGNGTNESGFTGKPSGARNGDARFAGIGQYVDWVSSLSGDTSCLPSLGYNDGILDRTWGNWDGCGFSVRCVKDQ